jgi:hypothetical protein
MGYIRKTQAISGWNESNPFGYEAYVKLEYPDTCPICHSHVVPEFLYAHFNDSDGSMITAMYYCSCSAIFLATYVRNFRGEYDLQTVFPDSFVGTEFSEDIKNLSPNFAVIYNQALHAESLLLDRICGMGYRKAVEYLVKDFCIHENPDDSNKIWSESLNASINRLNYAPMKELADKCRLLGNDEVHTIIRYEEGLPEMKIFILSLVRYVEMVLNSEKLLHPVQADQ